MLVNLTTPTHSSVEDPVRNHEEIVDALVHGEPDVLRQLIVDHVDDGWKRASAAVADLQTSDESD